VIVRRCPQITARASGDYPADSSEISTAVLVNRGRISHLDREVTREKDQLVEPLSRPPGRFISNAEAVETSSALQMALLDDIPFIRDQ